MRGAVEPRGDEVLFGHRCRPAVDRRRGPFDGVGIAVDTQAAQRGDVRHRAETLLDGMADLPDDVNSGEAQPDHDGRTDGAGAFLFGRGRALGRGGRFDDAARVGRGVERDSAAAVQPVRERRPLGHVGRVVPRRETIEGWELGTKAGGDGRGHRGADDASFTDRFHHTRHIRESVVGFLRQRLRQRGTLPGRRGEQIRRGLQMLHQQLLHTGAVERAVSRQQFLVDASQTVLIAEPGHETVEGFRRRIDGRDASGDRGDQTFEVLHLPEIGDFDVVVK